MERRRTAIRASGLGFAAFQGSFRQPEPAQPAATRRAGPTEDFSRLAPVLQFGASSVLGDLADVASTVAGVVAILGLAAGARGIYRRTLGRRRDRYAKLARLGVGAQLSFFTAVVGEPPAFRHTLSKSMYQIVSSGDELFDPARADAISRMHDVVVPAQFIESIFVDRDYYLQTITDDDHTVLAFSVTTRSKRFAPTFEAPPHIGLHARRRFRKQVGEPYEPLFRIRLGRTRFDELDPRDSDAFAGPHFRASPGARLFAYSEFKAFGNPGHYLDYVFTASSAGAGPADWGTLHRVIEQAGFHEWPYPQRPDPDALRDVPDRREPDWEEISALPPFRHRTAITTFTMIHHSLWLVNFPTSFGPDADLVRLLP